MKLVETRRLLTRKAAPLSDFALLMRRFNIDGPLYGGLLLISAVGLIVLYIAVGAILAGEALGRGLLFVTGAPV